MTFKLLSVFADLHRRLRRLVSIGVTAHPTAEWLARQISEAFPWDLAPHNLIRDRDRSYGESFTHRIRAMGIRDRLIASSCLRQNAYAGRVIGSIRRECLDHLIIFNETHLRHVLRSYFRYDNSTRTHLSLAKDKHTPAPFNVKVRSCASHTSAGCIIRSFESDYWYGQAKGLVGLWSDPGRACR